MKLLIIFGGLALIISKFFDVVSTIKRVRHYSGETNPIASRMMKKFGVQVSAWIIFVIVLLIVIYTVLVAFDTPTGFQIIYVALCIFITIVQSAVAYSNWKGEPNRITRVVIKIHQKINNAFKR